MDAGIWRFSLQAQARLGQAPKTPRKTASMFTGPLCRRRRLLPSWKRGAKAGSARQRFWPLQSCQTDTCGLMEPSLRLPNGRNSKRHTITENLKDMCYLQTQRMKTKQLTLASGYSPPTPRDYTLLA